MATKLTRVGDLTVAVERPPTKTNKTPVLLIHGMFAGAWMWDNYQSLFARHGYETHAINLRGHHGSRPVPDIGKVSVHDYVADCKEVARTLRNPIVIGHSMGGLLAQKLAEAGNVRALVLIGSAPPRWIPVISWRLLRRQVKYLRPITRDTGPVRAEAKVIHRGRKNAVAEAKLTSVETGKLLATGTSTCLILES